MTTLGVYAKAVAAFIATSLGAIGSWLLVVGDGPISRAAWGGLILAIGSVLGATAGVAVVTNQDDERPAKTRTLRRKRDDAGTTVVGIVLAVLVVLFVLGLVGATHHPLFLLILLVALLLLVF